jgi:hypothetical protein
MTKEKPREIELTPEEIEALHERIRRESLLKSDYGLLDAIVVNLVGSGLSATPSQQNGSYRPGKPLFD